MKRVSKKFRPADRSTATTIGALVLVALVPTACVLWFMSVAIRNERLAVEQRLTEVYQNHLASVQREIGTFWKERQRSLSAISGGSPAERFAAIVRSNLADSVILYDSAGKVLYPQTASLISGHATPEPAEWSAAREMEFQKTNYVTAAQAYARIAQSTTNVHSKARALQSQASCLIKGGKKEGAIAVLAELIGDGRLAPATSDQGTLIVPNAQLLLLKLLKEFSGMAGTRSTASLTSPDGVHQPENDRRERQTAPVFSSPLSRTNGHVQRTNGTRWNASLPEEGLNATLYRATASNLVERLNDYREPNLSSGQRRFLLEELRNLLTKEPTAPRPHEPIPAPLPGGEPEIGATHEAPRLGGVGGGVNSTRPDFRQETLRTDLLPFPTYEAELLAAEYLERNPAQTSESKLQLTPLKGVWCFGLTNQTATALFREDRLRAEMDLVLGELSLPDVNLRLWPPGEDLASAAHLLAREAGHFLPGWRLALGFKGRDPFELASQRQTRFYLWSGSLVVAGIVLLAILVARFVNAQMRLARLKNDLVSTVSHELRTPLASMRALVDTLIAGRYRDQNQLEKYLVLAAKENQRLSHLIENFLSFSRMELSKQKFRFDEVSTETIVRDAVDAVRDRFTVCFEANLRSVEAGNPILAHSLTAADIANSSALSRSESRERRAPLHPGSLPRGEGEQLSVAGDVVRLGPDRDSERKTLSLGRGQGEGEWSEHSARPTKPEVRPGAPGAKGEGSDQKNIHTLEDSETPGSESNSRLRVALAKDLPVIEADAEAITTVLINLLDNAYKYTETNKRVALRAYRNNGAACFEVEDNGIGLTPREAAKVFDRFYQVDQSLARKRGGCGLGLSIVQFIVKEHGGTIEVQSEPGRGSTFTVRLPAGRPRGG